MKQAKLIKKDEANQAPTASSSTNIQPKSNTIGSAMKTAKSWVKEFQTSDRQNARQQFAALFSQTITAA